MTAADVSVSADTHNDQKVHLGPCLQLGIQARNQSEYVALQFTKTTCLIYTHCPLFSHSLCFFFYYIFSAFTFLCLSDKHVHSSTDTHGFSIIETDAVPSVTIVRRMVELMSATVGLFTPLRPI